MCGDAVTSETGCRSSPCSCSSTRAAARSDGSPESILEEAQRLVYGDRAAAYGHPAENFARTASFFSAVLGVPVTAKQAALCMVGVKLARECFQPSRDNLVDGAGYFAVAARIEDRLAGRE